MTRLFETATPGAAEPVLDPRVIRELRCYGETFLRELVEEFTSATELLLAELREAFFLNDALAVARIAHSIRGSGGQLGGLRLANACYRLERRATYGSLPEGEPELEDVEREYDALRLSLTLTLPVA